MSTESHGIGSLPADDLRYLCWEGRTLGEIAELAGVTRQAVQQRTQGTELEAARKRKRAEETQARSFRRFRYHTRAGQRLATAAVEIREHCPDLSIEWRWNGSGLHSWQLLVDDFPLSVYSAIAVTAIGQPGYQYRVYRADLGRPDRAYLVITGDHRRFLYLDPPAPKYVWFEAIPPFRRSQNLAPDYEWRGGAA